MSGEALYKAFEQSGGRFFCPPDVFLKKMAGIRALIWDWDGVFNSGEKTGDQGSPFSEVDSMGTNLLRFALWKKNGELPFSAIITGARNASARYFAEREHLQAVFIDYKNKSEALEVLTSEHGIRPEEVAFFYDDVLDLPLAKTTGLRFQISDVSKVLFNAEVEARNWVDYRTAMPGGKGGLREACELAMAATGISFSDILRHRLEWTEDYAAYWTRRQAAETLVFSK